MSETVTREFAAIHRAALVCSEDAQLTPSEVLVLVAIRDLGGSATSHQLADAMLLEGTAIRRAALTFYASGLVIGVGSDGGKRRRGVVSLLTLTADGSSVVALFDSHLASIHRVLTADHLARQTA